MSTRTLFLLGYLVIALALIGLQLAARRPSARVAELGAVIGATKRRRVGWAVLVMAWWWLGFHVLARSSALEP